jgi:hypothetical protein
VRRGGLLVIVALLIAGVVLWLLWLGFVLLVDHAVALQVGGRGQLCEWWRRRREARRYRARVRR